LAASSATRTLEGLGTLHTTTGRWKLGLGLALTTAALWGSLPVALKSLLRTMEADTVVWYRFTVAAILLGGALVWRRKLPAALPRKRSVWLLLAVATIAFAANNVIFVKALGYISPTAAQVLIQLAPMLLLAGGVFVFRERFHRGQGFGVLLLLAGIVLFFLPRLQDLFSSLGDYAFGVLLVVLAAALWAAYAMAQKQLLTEYGSPVLMWMIYASGAILVLPLASPSRLFLLDGVQVGVLLYCALLTILGYGAFAEALAHWEATRVSAVIAITPLITWGINQVAATVAPGYAQAETIGISSLLGAGLVTAGSALTAMGKRG
jgi:drug/metabolite transporter (DMT)-like permease